MRLVTSFAVLACWSCQEGTKPAPPPASSPPPKPEMVQPPDAERVPAPVPVPPPPPPPPVPAAGSNAGSAQFTTIALPGGGSAGIAMDYILFDPNTSTVWVPAGNTGAVDVVDTATRKVRQVDGFATKDIGPPGKPRIGGPSSSALGDGVIYVGNRADRSICAVSDKTLKRGTCGTLDASPDGVLYVGSTHEVWVTTPRDSSIRVLDGKTLKQTARIAVDGRPEGYAVDLGRNRFYTNLEDKDATLVIDVKTHAVVTTWKPNCGKVGPRGLRVDSAAGWLFVACTDKVETLALDKDGQILGSVASPAGVDDFAYVASSKLLYVGAGTAGVLTVASVDKAGALAVKRTMQTVVGARNGVVDAKGVVYLTHSAGSELVVVDTSH